MPAAPRVKLPIRTGGVGGGDAHPSPANPRRSPANPADPILRLAREQKRQLSDREMHAARQIDSDWQRLVAVPLGVELTRFAHRYQQALDAVRAQEQQDAEDEDANESADGGGFGGGAPVSPANPGPRGPDALRRGGVGGANPIVPTTWLLDAHGGDAHGLLRSAKEQITKFAQATQKTVAHAATDVAAQGMTDGQQLLAIALQPLVDASGGELDPEDFLQAGVASARKDARFALLSQLMNSGGPLAQLLGSMPQESADQAYRTLLYGLGHGENPQALVSDLQQILNSSRSRALTISRTEMLNAYRGAQLDNYRANSDVVQGWIWLADLGSACFPAGTLITTRGGRKPIEQITRGDEVLTHEGRFQRVSATMVRAYAGDLYTIQTTDGRAVSATSEHPFLVERQGKLDWVEARDLLVGDCLICEGGRGALIAHIERQPQELTVYNFEVEGDHSYVANGFAVHNCPMCTDLNGEIHPLDDDMVSHPRCRCSPAPYTKSWDDILSPVGMSADDLGLEDTSLQVESGEDWFARQDEATQRAILGPSAFNAYSAGDLKLSDLVGRNADGGYYQKSLKEAGLNFRDYLPTSATAKAVESDVAAEAESAVATAEAEAAVAGPFGSVEDILARQDALESLYDIPMGDPTTLQQENPEAATRGQEQMSEMMGRLASELKDNGAFMRLARYYGYDKDSVDGWLVIQGNARNAVASGASYVTEEDKALAAMSRAEAKVWAQETALKSAIYEMLDDYHSVAAGAAEDITKWNSHPFQIAIVEAARKEFKLGNIAHDYYDAEQIAAAKAVYGTYENGIRAFLRQMHTDTQRYFEENGITEVQIFRGLRWNAGDQPAGVVWDGGMTENPISAQPLASWASNGQIAFDYATGTGMNFFADEPADYSMMLVASVPIDQILSIGMTGLGATPLRETMLLAGDYPVYAIPFQQGMTLDDIYQAMADASAGE